jgi:peptidylprolyl isomerase
MLVWAALCLWTGIMLAFNNAAAGNLAGGVALAGLLFSLPLLIAGSGFIALVLAALCSLLLYRLWDRSWQGLLLPAAAIALVSLSLGLAYAYLQASLLRSSLFLNPTAQVASAVELRLLEAEQSSAFLSAFYAFVIFTLLLGAFLASRHWMNKVSNRSSPAAYASLAVLAILLLMAINRSNMRIIQADVLYKRAKPFDANASSTRSPEDWEVAIAIYERAVDMVPLEDFYYLFLGRAFLEQSTVTTDPVAQDTLLERAQERLLEAQRINPLNTDHTANLARLNTRWVQLSSDESETQRRLEAAENYYQAALSLSPQNSIIRNEYARLTYDLKRDCDRAIEIYNESADIDPYYDVTYFGRAEILMACGVGKPEEVRRQYTLDAVGSLEEGLAINDGNVRVWLQLGQAYHELAVYEASLAAYEEARVRNNNEFPLWNFDYWMASVHIDMGDRETAENLVSQALQNAPLEAHAQIQALLGPQQISITESVPVPPLTSVPRPLSGLTPFERNNFYSEPPPMIIDLAKSYEAVMVTEKGEMRFRLLDDEAPLTVNNFAFLAGQGFYDGVSFFRVLEGFMAQGGDPTDGGTGGPGYRFADEFNPGRSFDRRGLLAMANAGPDTNGSQFFITFAPALHLNGRHTIFGELIAGDDVLGAISLRDPDNPAGPGDVLERVEIIEVGQ